MVCTFFGHRDCYELDDAVLQNAIEILINNGIDTFYIGNNGRFDDMAFSCLSSLQKTHKNISFSVVLAYLPTKETQDVEYYAYSLYPEEVEAAPRKFAIERRNAWMLDRSDYCICYVNRTWGGAYKFAHRAKCRGLNVINLGHAEL